MKFREGLIFFGLLISLSGCGAGKAPSSSTTPTALSRAAEWEKKGIPGLAEQELRKALSASPEDVELKWRLFRALVEQKLEGKTREASKLAQELSPVLDAKDPRQAELQSIIEGERKQASRRALFAAAEAGKPEAKALLEEYPESLRDADYLRLAFNYHYRRLKGSPKIDSDVYRAAQAWLATNPRDKLGEKAAQLVKQAEKGPVDTPVAAFAALRGQIASGRKPREKEFYLSSHPDLSAFEKLMVVAKVTEMKEERGAERVRLKVSVSFPDPYLKSSRSTRMELLYRKRGASWVLEPASCEFGGARVFHGDPAMSLTPSGIPGLLNVDDPAPVLRRELGFSEEVPRVTNIYGPSRYQREMLPRILSVLATPLRGEPYFATYNPAFRFPNGKGIGDTLADFQQDYTLERFVVPFEGIQGGGTTDMYQPFILTPRRGDVEATPWMPLVRIAVENMEVAAEIISDDPAVLGRQVIGGFAFKVRGQELLEEGEVVEKRPVSNPGRRNSTSKVLPGY